MSGNVSRRTTSLLSLGVVASLAKTDGASYEPSLTLGAKEDAIETTTNPKLSVTKNILELDEAKIVHTEPEGEGAAIGVDT